MSTFRRTTSAAAITDLTATVANGKVKLEWTTPQNAERFLIVYSKLPISRTYTKDSTKRNVWGCYGIENTLTAAAGQRQSIEAAGLPTGQKLYFAVLTFTADDNLSEASNIASVDVP